MRKLRSIQVLRAVAACSVVVFHSYQPADHVGYAAAGVDLFFVISGFIMANLARERTPGEFARGRLSRIYPLWWIAAVPWLLMVPRDVFAMLSTLTLWPIYGGEYVVPSLKVGWTLCLEILFYSGVTIAIATRPMVPMTVYAMLLFGALTTSIPLLHFVGSPMILEFLMGIAVAHLPRRNLYGLFILAGLALLTLTSPVTGDLEWSLRPEWALWRAFEWGVPAALIVWGGLSLESVFERPFFNVPVTIGDASYSIYLFHPLVSYGFTLFWPLRMMLAIGTGLAMYFVVERRLMAARQRKVGRLRRTLQIRPAPAPRF